MIARMTTMLFFVLSCYSFSNASTPPYEREIDSVKSYLNDALFIGVANKVSGDIAFQEYQQYFSHDASLTEQQLREMWSNTLRNEPDSLLVLKSFSQGFRKGDILEAQYANYFSLGMESKRIGVFILFDADNHSATHFRYDFCGSIFRNTNYFLKTDFKSFQELAKYLHKEAILPCYSLLPD